jgi:hypothetical protein
MKVLPVRHIYWEHLYNSVRHYSRVLHELQSLLIGAACHKAVVMRVERLQDPKGETHRLHVGEDHLLGSSCQAIQQ